MELKSVFNYTSKNEMGQLMGVEMGVWFVIISSMIRGRFGRNEVLLQINHKNCNFCEIKISYLPGDLKPNLT